MINYLEITNINLGVNMAFMNLIDIERRNNFITLYLDRIDIVGYACARNRKIFLKELEEFESFKTDLLIKYGSEEIDDNGNKTGRFFIDESMENYDTIVKEYDKIRKTSRDINIITIKYTDIIGLLSGNEILELDWMLED